MPAQGPPSAKVGEVSFNFDDADVFSVIQTIFGGVLKYNYVIDPKVKGRVNFRSVSPVARGDVMPLMEVILRLNGIGVIEEGGLYRIIPISDMPKEPAPVRIGREPDKVSLQGLGLLQVVPMNYISSTEMVKVLTPFLSPNALIVDVPKINYLILVDTDANVKRLLQLVEIFDSEKLRQIKPQVFVYPVQNTKAKDLSSLLQQIYLGAKAPPKPAVTSTTAKPGSGPSTPPLVPQTGPLSQIAGGSSASGGESLVSEITKIFPDEVTNSLVILATSEDYALILETLKKMDQVPRQVMIEVLIAEITLSDELRFGLEWSLKGLADKGFINITGSFIPTASSSTSSGTSTSTPAPGFTFLGIDKTGLIRGYLQALSTQGKTNVLASPHIMAADNREAKIQIGKQVPIVTDVISGVSAATQTVQYKDTGVILKIKPTINDSGLVSMELSQEVSDFVFQAIGTNTFPVFTKREASTYLVAQDGQTIVIGGLISENKGRTRSGLPFLSKIPILGYLFGYTDDTFDRTEIILLLTPKVVRNQTEAGNLTNYYIHRLDKSFEKQLNFDKLNRLREK
jgi:general secretion pathway protein D